MKSKTRNVKRLVRLLTDPVIHYVSLVGHGANQTPFKVVKNQEEIKRTKEETQISRPNDDVVGVARIEFSKDKFNKEEAETYLQKLGFEDFVIQETVSKINAVSSFSSLFNHDAIKEISSYDDGVSIFIGDMQNIEKSIKEENVIQKSGIINNEEEDKTLKDSQLKIDGLTPDEVVEKFDSFAAFLSQGQDLQEVLNDGMADGLPPGFAEIINSYVTVVSNASLSNNMQAIRQASQDMGELLIRIIEVFQNLVERQQEKITMSDMVDKVLKNVLKQEVEQTEETEAEKKEEYSVEEQTTEEKVETAEKKENISEETTNNEEVEKSQDTQEPIEEKTEETVEKKNNNFDELKSFISEQFKSLTEANKELADRVEKLESKSVKRQSDDSADEEIVETQAKQKENTKDEDIGIIRNIYYNYIRDRFLLDSDS